MLLDLKKTMLDFKGILACHLKMHKAWPAGEDAETETTASFATFAQRTGLASQ